MSSLIKIAICNGLSPSAFQREVLDINKVDQAVEIVKSFKHADVVVFGPYGSEIPPPGPYVRVAYICENLHYDGPLCDFVFRVPLDKKKLSLPSERIQWHGFDPLKLVRPKNHDPEAIYREKDRFCVFLYSNRVPYRELLFKALSKYRRVDAPGLSMNNHPSIDADAIPGESRWETKRRFLRKYKFTLAFESEMYPGYQTEKIYDSMLAESVPVYIGDCNISSIFNEESFLNLSGGECGYWIKRFEEFYQLRWFEIVGPHRGKLDVRVKRKLRRIARDARHIYFGNKISKSMVDHIVSIDNDRDKYVKMLSVPWLKDNTVPESSYSRKSWLRIFEMARNLRQHGIVRPIET